MNGDHVALLQRSFMAYNQAVIVCHFTTTIASTPKLLHLLAIFLLFVYTGSPVDTLHDSHVQQALGDSLPRTNTYGSSFFVLLRGLAAALCVFMKCGLFQIILMFVLGLFVCFLSKLGLWWS